MDGRVVKSEIHKGLHIVISAKYSNNRSIKVNGKWHDGKVVLYCDIYNGAKDVESFDSLLGCINENSPHRIGYERRYERYGFLKLKRKEYLIHISDEYDRVFPLFLEYCRDRAEGAAKRMNKESDAQKVTDGLPGSLKTL